MKRQETRAESERETRAEAAAARARQAIVRSLEASIRVKADLLASDQMEVIVRVARLIVEALRGGRKVVLFGNGGSAADAQHIAAELVGRFLLDRQALPAIALTTDTSILTAVGNDLGFDQVFARQAAALVQPGDVVVGLSTSGNSPNVVAGLAEAGRRGAVTVGCTGAAGGSLAGAANLCLCVPSTSTPRIQEAHLSAWHAICEVVERELGTPGTGAG